MIAVVLAFVALVEDAVAKVGLPLVVAHPP
jgi:hypothetical protein